MDNTNYNSNNSDSGNITGLDKSVQLDPIARKLQEMSKQENATAGSGVNQNTRTQSTQGQAPSMPGVWYPGMPSQGNSGQSTVAQSSRFQGRPDIAQGGASGNGASSNYQSPYSSPYARPAYGNNITEKKKTNKATVIFVTILILALIGAAGYGVYRYTHSDDTDGNAQSSANNNTQQSSDTVTVAPVPVSVVGHTEKDEKYYENEYFGLGCSLDDSWTVEKVQYSYYPKDIADMLGLQSGPDGSIPLVEGYDLDFYASRPAEAILVYVRNKDVTAEYDSERDYLISTKAFKEESDIKDITFLGSNHASSLIKYIGTTTGFQRFICVKKDNQYMVIELIAGHQDSTEDLYKYFYIPGQTTVSDDIKHPVDDGTIVASVWGLHDYFKVEASSTYSAKGYKFSADGLADGDVTTAWCGEASTGDTIMYEFDDVVELQGLMLFNGNLKDEASYNAYGRVTKIRMEYDGGSAESEIELIPFNDVVSKGLGYTLDFKKQIKTKYLKLTVLETSAGSSNNLPCISEITLNVRLKAYITRESTGEKFYVDTRSITIGAGESNTIRIDDSKLADEEVSVCYRNNEIYAMAALNPKDTKVDGVAIYGLNKMSLVKDSVIKVGKEKFTFGVEH